MRVNIEPSWKEKLAPEFSQMYFADMSAFVRSEYLSKTVYPKPGNVFRAFSLCPFDQVKVVVLGQDPYHGAGQANGLCFAVDDGMRIPPSLQNIFKEIESDIGSATRVGNLETWAKQGVLLLNATLTVRAQSPGSHQGRGWERFTDAAVQALSDEKEHLVFLLWGNYARQKGARIDREKHRVLEAPHPSPFSAHTGFLGCKHFSKVNEYLIEKGKQPIVW
ncbi:MAG: uracil-DNA glycosylase [Patescibacteria group bacterium]